MARIERALGEFGGALLADETGLGKTYVALAIARAARRPLIVSPAALRDMWRLAMATAGCSVPWRSIESLGRRLTGPRDPSTAENGTDADGRRADVRPDLVIIDEAHHARNPATARYRALATLTARARVLLLTATPVHNGSRDLESLLGLFLGDRARSLDPALSAQCIIRRAHSDAGPAATIPRVRPTIPLAIDHDHTLLDAIVALPPPVPPSDGGEAGILLSYSLIRQWASSQGALRHALGRRLARATALLAALESGRHPTRQDLAAWTFAESTLQLAFPNLVVDARTGAGLDEAERVALKATIDRHAAAIRTLLGTIRDAPDPDVQRAARLDALRSAHPRARIVAFTQFAQTAESLFERLRHRPRVCVLTAAGAEVAGGSLTRAEALARFAPAAHGRAPPALAAEVDLLIATDLLSEGVNLQDASVVVHLDLPWTPARIEQRIGRVARLGSRHADVHVYALEPPASAEAIIRLEDRLRTKLGAAARTVGIVGAIMPGLLSGAGVPLANDSQPPTPRTVEAIRALAVEWATAADRAEPRRAEASSTREGEDGAHVSSSDDSPRVPRIGAVNAAVSGWIAVMASAAGSDSHGEASSRIVVDVGGGATDVPDSILRAMLLAAGEDAAPEESSVATALRQIECWRTAHRLMRDLSMDAAFPARSRRRVVERIAAITRRAPKHLRPSIASLAAGARRSVIAPFGAGAERVLTELADAPMTDEAWLRAVKAFGEIHGGDDAAARPGHLEALLLLVAPRPR
jgi:hypothetical protein